LIVVDTSALMSILLGEPQGAACRAALKIEQEVIISAGTLAEAFILAHRPNVERS
jgi:ribonuclease VapC